VEQAVGASSCINSLDEFLETF